MEFLRKQPKNGNFYSCFVHLSFAKIVIFLLHFAHFEVNLANESSNKSGQMSTSRSLDCYSAAPVRLHSNLLRDSDFSFLNFLNP